MALFCYRNVCSFEISLPSMVLNSNAIRLGVAFQRLPLSKIPNKNEIVHRLDTHHYHLIDRVNSPETYALACDGYS